MPWVPLAAFLITFLLVRLLLSRFARFALDQPNERSLHSQPVPRTGGIAVLAGAAAAAPFAPELWLPMLLALLLAAVSFLDDIRQLRRSARLLSHGAAAVALSVTVLSPLHAAQWLLLILAVVWITNLYNFMDGADGVAGGMAVIGFSAYALAAGVAEQTGLAVLSGAIAAAALAFLLHNFYPARIFLGDVGAIPLGFLAAALGLVGWHHGAWPLWFPLLVFGPFNADATVTLVKRVARGERAWQAHREHYYQRIVRMGLGHRTAALIGYAVMLFCAGMALLGRAEPPIVQAGVFLLATFVLGVMAIWVDRRWARFAAA